MPRLKISVNKIRKLCDQAVSYLSKEKYEVIKHIPTIGIRHLFDAPSHEYKTNNLSEKILTLQILSEIGKCRFYDLITAYVKDQEPHFTYRIDGTAYFLFDYIAHMDTLHYPITKQINQFILNREWEKWKIIIKEQTYESVVENIFSQTLGVYMQNLDAALPRCYSLGPI